MPELILNFHWALKNQLATGSKPSRAEAIAWLQAQGFGALVSLEPIPDYVASAIKQAGFTHLVLPIQDDEDGDFNPGTVADEIWAQFAGFISCNLKKNRPVFVHCSAGIKRSPRLVRHYLANKARVA